MHRCRKCDARHRLPKHINEYSEDQPACRSCGGKLRLDLWADGRKWRVNTCVCDAYHYPHNKDHGKCVASEREQALRDILAAAPPHPLDEVF